MDSVTSMEAATGYVIVVSLMVTGIVIIWATSVFFGIIRDVVHKCTKNRRNRRIERRAWGR